MLVLPADHDPSVFRRPSREVAGRITGARLVEFAETDHVVPLRRPDESNRVVL